MVWVSHSLADALILESQVTNWNNLLPQFIQCLFVGHTDATRAVSAIQRDVWGWTRRTGWKQVVGFQALIESRHARHMQRKDNGFFQDNSSFLRVYFFGRANEPHLPA